MEVKEPPPLNSDCLNYMFDFLSNEDIVRCTQVCTSWRYVALDYLTRRLQLNGHIKVYNCNHINTLLERDHIVCLDLTEIALPESQPSPIRCKFRLNVNFWSVFSSNIGKLKKLKNVKLRFCPTTVIESLSTSNPNLKKLKAVDIKSGPLSLPQLTKFNNLIKLELCFCRSDIFQFNFQDYPLPNEKLESVKYLTITGATDLNILNIVNFVNPRVLDSLSLGTCRTTDIIPFTNKLSELNLLRNLRLEKCIGNDIITVFNTVGTMQNITHLEVIDIDVPDEIDEAISACINLKKLLIAANPRNCDGIKNRAVLCGVVQLRSSLTDFCWIFSRELFSASYNDIVVFNELPVLDDRNEVIVSPLNSGEPTIFDTDTLGAFLMQFLPNCTAKIIKTSYINSYLISYPF